MPTDETPSWGTITDWGTATADNTTVMAEVTSDASNNSLASQLAGGTVTYLLRSIEADQSRMVVRFAIRWDNPDKPDSAQASRSELGIALSNILAIDKVSLTGYRPFCSRGSYSGGNIERSDCLDSQLVVPDPASLGFAFPNHALIEGYAIMPGPAGKPATVDFNLGNAIFTDATVTYR